MAVYTHLDKNDIENFLSHYDLGELASFTGIAEGVQNTNYLLDTSNDRFILTLFEQRTKLEDLPYFAALMEWLHARGIPCPLPVKRSDGRVFGVLHEKPALMVTFLTGSSARAIRNEHVPQVGTLAAQMHIAGIEFPRVRDNAMSISGWEDLLRRIDGRADEIQPGLNDILEEELRYVREHWPQGLPSGPVHADLFPDNVFFERGKLSGVIDFYYACNDAWAYDLAICINAWCFDDRHRFVKERADMLMHAYCDTRSLEPEEEQALPILLRGAALRFLLTRTHDWLFAPSDAIITRKDPLEYLAKLEFHRKAQP